MGKRPFCLLGLTILVVVCGLVSRGWGQNSRDEKEPGQLLAEAREALKGPDKRDDIARWLLVELDRNHTDDLSPTDLCYVYVYLGYIEDRAGNREAAIDWYKKAFPLDGPKIEGIRGVAKNGLTRRVSEIYHLDRVKPLQKPKPRLPRLPQRIGDAVVMSDMPKDLPPRMDLSEAEHMENFELLWQSIDEWYSFFDHKDIDWAEVKARYRPKVQAAETADDYYHVLDRLLRELQDFHSRLCNWGDEYRLPGYSPPLAIRRIGPDTIVTRVAARSEAAAKGLRPGSKITHVDGLTVAGMVEQLRPRLPVSSSERHFEQFACRRLLDGQRGSRVAVSFLPPGEDTPVQVDLVRDTPLRGEYREPGFPVKKGKYVWSGIHPSGCGYIRIISFRSGMEIADEFDAALGTLKDTNAVMIDIRDNTGGFGSSQTRILGRFISKSQKVGVGHVKIGRGHRDFSRRNRWITPTGPWQYTKPIALLMNEITGSASDLFARDLIGTGRAITIGTTTHGNSTGMGVYVVLPCALVVRVSCGYTSDNDGRIIEVNGNVPEIPAKLTVDNILNGTDSVVTRAVEALTAACESSVQAEAVR